MEARHQAVPFLSVVIPAFNEAESIAPLLKEISEVISSLSFPAEVTIVDDGSTDGTGDEVLRHDEIHSRPPLVGLTLIRLKKNFGQSIALAAGIEAAKGEVIATLDADGQNDPHDIPKLLKLLNDGFDVVCGWRKERKDKFLTRVLPSRIANWLIRVVTGVPVHDVGCTLRVYRAPVIKEIARRGLMHRYLPVQCYALGAKISEVEVNHRPRLLGRSKYGLGRVFNVLRDLPVLYSLNHRLSSAISRQPSAISYQSCIAEVVTRDT